MQKPEYRLKKSLGQHFLHNEQICQKIIDAVEQKPKLKLLEIGPGAGALSKYLIEWKDVHYKAIEIDEEKVIFLEKTYPSIKDHLLNIDFLKAEIPFEDDFSIIGNFPYNISSSILFKVLEWEPQVKEVVGMFQKEVAMRIASKEGNKSYGILSVLMQTFYSVEYLFDVGPGNFTPPPKVMSGILKFRHLDNPYDILDKKAFIRFVKAAFSQRRKTLRNALKSNFPVEKLSDEIFNKRAEQLSVQAFTDLFKHLQYPSQNQ